MLIAHEFRLTTVANAAKLLSTVGETTTIINRSLALNLACAFTAAAQHAFRSSAVAAPMLNEWSRMAQKGTLVRLSRATGSKRMWAVDAHSVRVSSPFRRRLSGK